MANIRQISENKCSIGPNPDHNNNHCAHDYKITRYVMPHPKGGEIVMGDDNEFHVVHKDCLNPDLKPEIWP